MHEGNSPRYGRNWRTIGNWRNWLNHRGHFSAHTDSPSAESARPGRVGGQYKTGEGSPRKLDCPQPPLPRRQADRCPVMGASTKKENLGRLPSQVIAIFVEQKQPNFIGDFIWFSLTQNNVVSPSLAFIPSSHVS